MKQTTKILSLCGLALLAVGCENQQGKTYKPTMYESSALTQREITVDTSRFVEKKPTNEVNYAYLSELANEYTRHGSSPMYVILAYNPEAKNGKLTSFNKSNIIKGQLAKLGIKNAVVKTMPVIDAQEEVVVGYDHVTAKGPENCGKMPGHGVETGHQDNYGLGCTVKDMIAKQVAYPSDLTGKDEMSTFEAGRVAAPVNRDTRSGEISDFVPSYILSEVGN